MSVIEAASAGVKDMADGSLRITFEFEPRFAAEAFALFGPRGRAVAVAALMDGAKAVKEPEPPKEPIGPLCKWLVMRCAEPEFWKWLGADLRYTVGSEDGAAFAVKHILGVTSRKDVDGNPEAVECFHSYIRKPYQAWLAKGKK